MRKCPMLQSCFHLSAIQSYPARFHAVLLFDPSDTLHHHSPSITDVSHPNCLAMIDHRTGIFGVVDRFNRTPCLLQSMVGLNLVLKDGHSLVLAQRHEYLEPNEFGHIFVVHPVVCVFVRH